MRNPIPKQLISTLTCEKCKSTFVYTTKKNHVCRRCGYKWVRSKTHG